MGPTTTAVMEPILTIRGLLAGQSTLTQLGILMRADVLLQAQAGRYYGGILTEVQATALKGEQQWQ